MTTTSTYQGMDSDSKPTSRVLRPPGGGSSNIFGGFEEEASAPRRQAKPADVAPEVNSTAQGAPAQSTKPSKERMAYNPITGMPYETPKSAAAPAAEEDKKEEEEKKEADETAAAKETAETKPEAQAASEFRSTRVSQPPGGRSTKLW